MRQQERERDVAAHRVACEDSATREEQQRDQLQCQLARADPQYHTIEQQMENTRRQQVHTSTHPTFRGLHYQPHNILTLLM